jgi:Rrf2 family nitric oxide-sensitive transcriptional repressor
MRLTRQTDYSLRVLIHLAVHGERLATIEEISEAYGISRAHLMKVVHELGRTGFLETLRGRGGGLRLARPAAEIRVGEVVRAVEGSLALVDCLEADGGDCRIEPACALRAAFVEALEAFFTSLDGHTLADLIDRRRAPLRRLLAVS